MAGSDTPHITRASNVLVHPGLSSAPRPRQTSAQVKADNAAKAAAKEDATKQKAANIANIAALENDTQKKVKRADLDANRPRDKLQIMRAERQIASPVKGGTIASSQNPSEESQEPTVLEPSGSPKKPAEDEQESNDEDMDIEDDPDTTINKLKKPKKVKKGLELPDQINKLKFADTDTGIAESSLVSPDVPAQSATVPSAKRRATVNPDEPPTR
ncbi:hypothetical protein DXG03_008588 [Asterophora parasitica]|uniref:Uncharacterized protein n=1 Tax=Asterophora parasitica TaxID=117018 RepID=A0A9P7K912_9AGAR|nr:hypothetical protein DXG03_008588 [Asterophora parasitica]